MKKPRLCRLCNLRTAVVPDRDKLHLKPWAQVCRECHAKRLLGDLKVMAQSKPLAYQFTQNKKVDQ